MPLPTSLIFIILGAVALVVYFLQTKKQNKFIRIYLFLGVIFILLGIIPGIIMALKDDKGAISLIEISKQPEEIKEELFVVSGEFVCLPLKNENVLHNDLCAFGINSNEEYYRLQSINDNKFNLMAQLETGQRIEVSGVFIDEESNTYKTLGTVEVETVKMLDSQNNDISNLPDSFKADYISFSNFSSNIFKIEDYHMPGLSIVNGEIDCEETNLSPSVSTLTNKVMTSKKEINGKRYCVMYSIEGAAGSVFTQNAHTTVIEDNVYLINFVARYNNCGNYPEEELVKCVTERENFNLDILVDLEVEKMRS